MQRAQVQEEAAFASGKEKTVMIVAFAAGACFGMIIASAFAAAGRCSYEEEVRTYYERRMQQDGHRDVAGGSRTDLRS